jgi:hypothetical protein
LCREAFFDYGRANPSLSGDFTMNTVRSWPGLRAKALTVALTLACAQAAFAASALATKPDALLQIDLNRVSVVEKIVESWKGELPAAQMGSFRSKLSALRADQLLAATLSGSFDGVLEVMNSHEAAQKTLLAQSANVNANGPERSKALGDANADLVYTPVVPCRLFDTRAGLASALGTVGGTFSNQQTKTITPAGACGIPTTGVASLFLSFHAYNNNPERLGVIGYMAPGTAFTALAATWTGAVWTTGTFITRTNPNGSFDAFVGNGQAMTADMVVDVMGYFKAPGGIIGDITDIQTAAGSGLTGGSASGVASLSLANSFKLPQACGNAQVPKFNTGTSLWECSNDLQGTGAGGTGTVTSIATGAGLSGGPITTTGTINLASTQLLPTTACAANQIPKWNGSGWACAADATPTNAWVQGGNSFGAPGVVGTADGQPMTVKADGTTLSLLAGVNGGTRLTAVADANFRSMNTIAGSTINGVTIPGVVGATIGGGGGDRIAAGQDFPNLISASFATIGGGFGNTVGPSGGTGTVGGGFGNTAGGIQSTVAGGTTNTASSVTSTVGGGERNTASGQASVISGGETNTASALHSVVPGGLLNVASGRASFAAGQGAKTQSSAATPVIFDGAFVWSDSNSGGATQNFHAAAEDEFAVRARGGVRLVTGVDTAGLPLSTFSIEAATGNVNAPSIVTAQGKFAAPNNFPGGINTKQVGDRFRDNSIVAWARIPSSGGINAIGRFGMTSVTRTGVGAYRVVIDVTLNSSSSILPVVTPEIDTRPTTASQIRVASVRQGAANNAFDVWMNDGTGAPVDNDFMLIVTGR